MAPVPKELVLKVLALLREATKGMHPPMSVALRAEYGRDPFIILISCLLSLRARDVMTYPISKKLFAVARTPQQIIELDRKWLEELFYPLGFYRRKALLVQDVSQELLERFDGKVPDNESDLLSIKGVGRKTANLVLGMGFDIPAICVDTHVHKISHRSGWVATKNPDETEKALKEIIPREYWIELNNLFVMWGQNICVPISPLCSRCVLSPLCPKIDVTRRR